MSLRPSVRLLLGVLAAAGCRGRSGEKPDAGVEGAGPSRRSATLPAGSSEPVLRRGVDTGWAARGGLLHRPVVRECPNSVPRDEPCGLRGPPSTSPRCRLDTDCPGARAFCGWDGDVPAITVCSCTTGCTVDADCGRGEVCACPAPTDLWSPRGHGMGRCIAAACRSDADCGAGLCLVTPTSSIVGVSWRSWRAACTKPEDECVSDADCAGARCVLGPGDVRRCRPSEGVAGRPLAVDGVMRIAALRSFDDWC